jgi:hypothetical protein
MERVSKIEAPGNIRPTMFEKQTRSIDIVNELEIDAKLTELEVEILLLIVEGELFLFMILVLDTSGTGFEDSSSIFDASGFPIIAENGQALALGLAKSCDACWPSTATISSVITNDSLSFDATATAGTLESIPPLIMLLGPSD